MKKTPQLTMEEKMNFIERYNKINKIFERCLFMEFKDLIINSEYLLRIIVASICGCAIGFERKNRHKELPFFRI